MVSPSPIFPDTQNHWARLFIQGLLTRGVVNGFRDRTFRPNQAMTRAEYAAVLQKAFTRPKVRQYVPFVDVPSNFWATRAIQIAFETGFISGFPNRQFHPQDNITRVQVLLSLMGGLGIISTAGAKAKGLALSEIYQDASQIPGYAAEAVASATLVNVVVNAPDVKILNPSRVATRGEVAAFIYQALVYLKQASAVASEYVVQLPPPKMLRQGTNVSLNGRFRQVSWSQWGAVGLSSICISDSAVMAMLGIELLNTNEVTLQPGLWFSDSSNPLSLETRLDGVNRYLEITDLASAAKWQVQVDGNTLNLVTGAARVENITVEEPSIGSRVVVDLNRPIPWQVRQQSSEWIVTLDATADKSLVDRFGSRSAEPKLTGDKDEGETGGSQEKPLPPVVESGQNQTIIRGNLPDGLGIRASTLVNPSRVVIELRPDALAEKDILWTSGLRWRQQYLSLGTARFPVFWLNINLRSPQLRLRPIWTEPNTMTGTSPLLQMQEKWQVFAAVNGGFFNRNNLLPLGAIRRQGQWLSGPILNRGVIAWNDTGDVKMGRMSLEETLVTSAGQRLPIVLLNSGYVQAGIARYTPTWGATYTPLINNEILVVVQNNQVTSQTPSSTAGQTPVAIPRDGYLLTLRSNSSAAPPLSIGTKLQIETRTVPADFNQFPHTLGAGPLLLQNGQIVLDAKTEGFSDAFVRQAAIRSAVGVTGAGELMICAVHNRIGGMGATLTETTQLMQQLGAIDALNLDGGSSTSLTLGGQLLNRPPDTAARVHNGLGIFRTAP